MTITGGRTLARSASVVGMGGSVVPADEATAASSRLPFVPAAPAAAVAWPFFAASSRNERSGSGRSRIPVCVSTMALTSSRPS